MMAESNKTRMQRFTQFINTASEELTGELISADAIFHVPEQAKPMRGPTGYLAIIGMMRGLPATNRRDAGNHLQRTNQRWLTGRLVENARGIFFARVLDSPLDVRDHDVLCPPGIARQRAFGF